MKRWSLRARFLLLLIALLAAVFAAITFVIVRQNTATLRANLIDRSKSFAALATQPIGGAFVLYQNSGTIRIQQEIGSFTDLDSNINQVEIVDTSGNRLFVDDPSHPIIVNSNATGSLSPSYLHDTSGNLTGIVQPYIESFGIHRYAVVYGISYQSVNKDIQDIVTFIVALSAGILLVSLVVWYFLINRLFLRPVADVSRVALLISQGDLNRQVHLDRNDEIGDLAVAVDTMASSLKGDIAKLKELDTMKSEFMLITSHNLRTPITVIKAYLEQIESLQPPAKLRQILKPISVNVMRLGGFAEDVLTISIMEAGQDIMQFAPVEMAPLLHTIVDQFNTMAEEKELKFTATIATSAWVNLSKTHFRSALWNLLDNAYKFTAKNGSVSLTAESDNDHLKIAVQDTGTGIAVSEIPHLFTKFHRATDMMTYDYEGTGIGLYIAKLIIERHGGTIGVHSVEGEGSTFTITLPVVKPPQLPAQTRG